MDKYIYYVEGDNEKKVVDTLKERGNEYIVSGKSNIFNIIQEKIKKSQLMTLNKSTVAIVIFDNDVLEDRTQNQDVIRKRLIENISLLRENCKQVVVICQYDNIEDEIIKSTNIRKIKELLNSKSDSDWKTDVLNEKKLMKKLLDKEFDFSKFWQGEIPVFINKVETSKKIKLKQ